MNNKLFNVILFTAGVAIGSAVTWKLVKTKYEQIAQEEIDSVKSEYTSLMQKMKSKLQEDVANNDNSDDEDDIEEDLTHGKITKDEGIQESLKIKYYNLSSKYRSSDDDDEDDTEEGGTGDSDEAPYINGPYVISPDDFRCSPPGYNAQALDYYSDGILADGWGVQVDIEDTIGEDSLQHFGEYVDDIVYVRNERNEIDYEVTQDPRTYAEATQM